MKVYLAEWPNGTISILTANDEVELFSQLDEEADPNLAKIYIMPTHFHISTYLKKNRIETDYFHGKEPKEFRFSDGIFERVYF
jgi:hypothetical protein